MAQRIYLVPIPTKLLQLYELLAAAHSDDQALEIVGECEEYSRRQQQCTMASKEAALKLDKVAFEKEGLLDDYYLYSALRPYLITSKNPRQAVADTAALRTQDVNPVNFFEQQLQKLPTNLLKSDIDEKVEKDTITWPSIVEDLLNVRRMREAAEEGKLFAFERQIQEEFAPGISKITEKTETVTLAGPRLLESYGQLCGFALARLAGHSEPTWWLGRNYWPGLLLGAELGPLPAIFKPQANRAMKSIASAAQLPAVLFEKANVPGFETGFSFLCEGYSSGLYFSPDSVLCICESLEANAVGWKRLSKLATGYSEEEVWQLLQMLSEAFNWAADQKCGLLEADEAVGLFGFR